MPDLIKDYCEKFVYNLEREEYIDDDEDVAEIQDRRNEESSSATLPTSLSRLRATYGSKLSDDKKYRIKKVSRKKRDDFDSSKNICDSNLERKATTNKDNYKCSGTATVTGTEKINLSDIEDENSEIEENYLKTMELDSDGNIEGSDINDSEDTEEEMSEDVSSHINNSEDTEGEMSEDSNAESDYLDETEKSFKQRKKLDGESETIENVDDKDDKIQIVATDHKLRSNCVRNQIAIYDSLMEMRIQLQKINTLSNQLPQYDKFITFLEQNDEAYISSLKSCRKASMNFMGQLVDLQEDLMKQFPGTKTILENCEQNRSVENVIENGNTGNKRKFKDFSGILKERHKRFKSFRDDTLTFCQSKVKQIYNQQNFNNFDTSIVQQYQNALSNRENLLKRTRHIAETRNNKYRILGKDTPTVDVLGQKYDPEIFDDFDFYSRLLEEYLKTKSTPMNQSGELSREVMEMKKLRKNDKYVERRKSKQRSLNQEIRSKAQQFIGPMKIYVGNHSAIDILHKNIFGSATNC